MENRKDLGLNLFRPSSSKDDKVNPRLTDDKYPSDDEVKKAREQSDSNSPRINMSPRKNGK